MHMRAGSGKLSNQMSKKNGERANATTGLATFIDPQQAKTNNDTDMKKVSGAKKKPMSSLHAANRSQMEQIQ